MALAAGGAWAAAVGVREYLSMVREGYGTWRAFGGFHNPNVLAGHLALVLPLMAAAVLALRARDDAWRAAWPVPAMLLGLSLAAVAFTASRLGMAAAGLGLALFCVGALAQRRRLTPLQVAGVAAILLVAGLAAALAVPTVRMRLLFALSGHEGFSLGFRFTTWAAALQVFLAHPLTGSGAGTFGSLMTRFSATSWTENAHNYPLQTLAETGVVGLVGLVWALGAWGRRMWGSVGVWGCGRQRDRGRRTDDGTGAAGSGAPVSGLPSPVGPPTLPHSHTLLVLAALAGVIASGAHALVDVDWSVPATGWILWALLGAGLAAAGAPRRVAARPGLETAGLVALLLCLVPAWVTATAGAHASLGDLHRDRSEVLAGTDPAQAGHEYQRAAVEYREAVRLDPWWPEARRDLGRVLGGMGLSAGNPTLVEEGRLHLQASVRLAPTVALTRYHLGLLEVRAGRTEEAAAAFRGALEWDPHSTYALRQLGQLYEETRPEETLAAARRLAEIEASPYGRIRPIAQSADPNYAFAHYWLGREHERAGDAPAARREYEAAAEILKRHAGWQESTAGFNTAGRKTTLDPELQALERRTAEALGRL